MKYNKLIPFILLALLAVVALFINQFRSTNNSRNVIDEKASNLKQNGLNRNASLIYYSKHAKCRMACREVSELEVADILQNGKINYAKSQLQAADCKKKYALEGYSKDGQHLRIIFAPCNNKITVVTCIDLNTEWKCDCK